ncbi:hypothetical protein LV89_04458 [Arcicella aurantiaca]|uniref:Uncharacterized protein n=1 Tax=Arcicella aurantiaca TaxID=591202 RepID=A0A316DI43_9BACT|nr:hypothetical protein [Arcicella aurantiaca]PWK17172.1 hypothetical protein LV89_04458 [Arcicella aurantiaca]
MGNKTIIQEKELLSSPETVLNIIQTIEKEKENHINILIELFRTTPSGQNKNDVVLLLSEYEVEDFVSMVIDEIKKNINGRDIGTLIYSLNGKFLRESVYDLIVILCSLKTKYDNFEALEMIKLVLEENNELFSKKVMSKAIKKVNQKIAITNEKEDSYKYLKWCLIWLNSRA